MPPLILYLYCRGGCNQTTPQEETGPRLNGKVPTRCLVCGAEGHYTFGSVEQEIKMQAQRRRENDERLRKIEETWQATHHGWQDFHCDRLGLHAAPPDEAAYAPTEREMAGFAYAKRHFRED